MLENVARNLKRKMKKTYCVPGASWGWTVPEAASSSNYNTIKEKTQTIRYCACEYYYYKARNNKILIYNIN